MGGETYEPLGRPGYLSVEGQLWQGAELGEACSSSSRDIAILAKTETDFPMCL